MIKTGLSLLVATAAACGVMFLSSCGGTMSGAKLSTSADSAAYAIGLGNGFAMGQSLAGAPGDSLDVEILARALRDGLKGDTSVMTPQKAQMFVQEYFQKVQEKQEEDNKKAGQDFLSENGKKEGVVTTASGLQYKILEEGNGPKPAATDTVKIHYKGTYLDGTTFDSSYDRNEPAKFVLNQVIPGWTEGVQLMNQGSKFMLWIPENLAYGARPLDPSKGGYQTLTFECELLEVIPGAPAPEAK